MQIRKSDELTPRQQLSLPLTPAVFPAALWPAAAVEVYTSKEVDAVNGTNLRLKCTFSSSSPISQHLSVTWNFQPEDLSSHEPVSETFTLHFIDAHLPKQTSPKAQHWLSPVTAKIPGVGMNGQAQLKCTRHCLLKWPQSSSESDWANTALFSFSHVPQQVPLHFHALLLSQTPHSA